MATILLTYPDQYREDLLASFRSYLGDDAQGLSDEDLAKKALMQWARGMVKAVRRRSAPAVLQSVRQAQAALENETVALQDAVQARKEAEEAEDKAIDQAFQEVD